MKEIIETIKKSVKDQMDQWQEDRYKILKDLELYCTKTVFEETRGLKGFAKTNRQYELQSKKGWSKSMTRYFHRSKESLKEMIKKEAVEKLEKIDVAVSKKLKDVKIKTIKNVWFNSREIDGYIGGGWIINGDKTFSFESIYAGGYNIQRLHIRTLYKFK